MEEKINIKVMAAYNGHSIKTNKSVDLSLKCKYDQLTSYIQLIQFLNVDTNIIVKIPDEKPLDLGSFRVKAMHIEDDGDAVLKFNGMTDFVNADYLNQLVGTELVIIKFVATIELEEEEDQEPEEDWDEE